MVNRLKHRESETTKNYLGNTCNLYVESLEGENHVYNKSFDFVREDEEFKRLLRELKKYAN